MDVEKLIEEIRKFPVVYDQSNDKYRNTEYKEKVWKKIADNLELGEGTTLSKIEKLKSLMNTYWVLCDAVHQANDFYCDQLMAVMFSLFVHVTIKAYFFFLFLRAGEVFAMISEAAWVLVYICYAVLLVKSGTDVTKSADEMRLVICQLVNKDLNPSLRKQLEVFLLQLLHHNTKFSARGFFQIHNETLTSMAGAVTTYLVILIQFQTERQTT
ncbi:putative gustatory receptor 28b [Homalodisca vitripennis]|uniref:putative gustatory receptor 28b n=1 Tax=Homalodisca vitripennis TaxID=197043 RepID=UPI001EEC203E|nr:putative gustatory receptor 28b [Homalodisca vitripennis]